MSFTLEQARTLAAVARLGSFAKAAAHLQKAHTAVVYTLKTMETVAGVPLLDRSGYRTKLTPLGERVLEQCDKLLAVADELDALVRNVRVGYEPWLKVVFDGLLPAAPILAAAHRVSQQARATKVCLACDFLSGVEALAAREQADVMLAVLPPERPFPVAVPLAPLTSLLVAQRHHPLALLSGRVPLAEMQRHTFLTVHGSDPRLGLATAALEQAATFHLSDFHAKKDALLAGIGFGWMPEHLILDDLAEHRLVVLDADFETRHAFRPTLHWHGEERAGKAARTFVEVFVD